MRFRIGIIGLTLALVAVAPRSAAAAEGSGAWALEAGHALAEPTAEATTWHIYQMDCDYGAFLVEEESGGCAWDLIVVGLATVGYAAASTALASCGTTGGLSCGPAFVAYVAASAALADSIVRYDECRDARDREGEEEVLGGGMLV